MSSSSVGPPEIYLCNECPWNPLYRIRRTVKLDDSDRVRGGSVSPGPAGEPRELRPFARPYPQRILLVVRIAPSRSSGIPRRFWTCSEATTAVQATRKHLLLLPFPIPWTTHLLPVGSHQAVLVFLGSRHETDPTWKAPPLPTTRYIPGGRVESWVDGRASTCVVTIEAKREISDRKSDVHEGLRCFHVCRFDPGGMTREPDARSR